MGHSKPMTDVGWHKTNLRGASFKTQKGFDKGEMFSRIGKHLTFETTESKSLKGGANSVFFCVW